MRRGGSGSTCGLLGSPRLQLPVASLQAYTEQVDDIWATWPVHLPWLSRSTRPGRTGPGRAARGLGGGQRWGESAYLSRPYVGSRGPVQHPVRKYPDQVADQLEVLRDATPADEGTECLGSMVCRAVPQAKGPNEASLVLLCSTWRRSGSGSYVSTPAVT